MNKRLLGVFTLLFWIIGLIFLMVGITWAIMINHVDFSKIIIKNTVIGSLVSFIAGIVGLIICEQKKVFIKENKVIKNKSK